MCHKIIMHVITDKVSHLRVNNIFHKPLNFCSRSASLSNFCSNDSIFGPKTKTEFPQQSYQGSLASDGSLWS